MSMTTRPFRHYTWKKARQIPSGEYTSDEVVGVARRIGREDILAVVIGHTEHLECVCGVGKFVGIHQFFGLLSTHHSKGHVNEEVFKSIKKEIIQEMR
ncbi:hypothetical protein LR48_Vigan01g153700 [Vigna angularis]|uniref:Uncharacterized protein n=1 Tax=Phaseolus angularis TaxID=3914 RepID=A0A0L9TNF3_PHAAN|nr:hypothetical protein LR48_Vigan01g153700 [Vigna angularis]